MTRERKRQSTFKYKIIQKLSNILKACIKHKLGKFSVFTLPSASVT